jgi:hypothetical protein
MENPSGLPQGLDNASRCPHTHSPTTTKAFFLFFRNENKPTQGRSCSRLPVPRNRGQEAQKKDNGYYPTRNPPRASTSDFDAFLAYQMLREGIGFDYPRRQGPTARPFPFLNLSEARPRRASRAGRCKTASRLRVSEDSGRKAPPLATRSGEDVPRLGQSRLAIHDCA